MATNYTVSNYLFITKASVFGTFRDTTGFLIMFTSEQRTVRGFQEQKFKGNPVHRNSVLIPSITGIIIIDIIDLLYCYNSAFNALGILDHWRTESILSMEAPENEIETRDLWISSTQLNSTLEP